MISGWHQTNFRTLNFYGYGSRWRFNEFVQRIAFEEFILEKCVHALFRPDHVCDFWSSIKHLKQCSDLVFFLKGGVQYEPKVNAKELMLYFFAVLFKLSFSTDLRPRYFLTPFCQRHSDWLKSVIFHSFVECWC